MRKIKLYIFFFLPLLMIGQTFSQPYLKIQNIDASRYPYVNLGISVSNVTPIENLNESNFSVFENGWKASYFRIKKIQPEKSSKRIVLLVDASKSLSAEAFHTQIQSISMLVNSIYQNDEVAVISFNDTVKIRCGFTSSREQLTQCIQEIKQEGKHTVMFDALYKSLELLSSSQVDRNFIVLFTDGKEEDSSIEINELLNYSQKFPIFMVCTGKNINLKQLARLAHLSGGEIYNSPGIKSISRIYSLLQILMDNTYELEYISQTQKGLESKREVEIRFEYNDLRDQDRSEFIVPESSIKGWIRKFTTDESFLFFGIISLLLLVIVLILLAFSRKPQRNEEVYTPVVSQEKIKSGEKEILIRENRDDILKDEKPLRPPSGKLQAFIIQKEGPMTGHTHKLNFESTTIGHGNENSIVIDDPYVSYSHSKIVLKNDQYIIYDLLSEYGVYVNGKKILRPKYLNDFDEIRLGKTVLLFRKTYR